MNSSVKFFAIIAIFMNGFVFGADIDNEARRDNEATIERLYNQYHEVHFYLSSYLSYFKSFLGRNVCDEREEFTDFFNQLDEEKQGALTEFVGWFHDVMRDNQKNYLLNKVNENKASIVRGFAYFAAIGFISMWPSEEDEYYHRECFAVGAAAFIGNYFTTTDAAHVIEDSISAVREESDEYRQNVPAVFDPVQEALTQLSDYTLPIFQKVLAGVSKYREAMNWDAGLEFSYDSIDQRFRRQSRSKRN